MNPFPNYLTELPPLAYIKIIRSLHIADIEALKKAYPYLSRVTNDAIIELSSSKEYTTDFNYYASATNLEYCSDYIVFGIKGVYDLICLTEFKHLKQINLLITKKLANEYESLLYLENMMYGLFLNQSSSTVTTLDKTYRLLFNVKSHDHTYAYVLDRGFFCTVNCNQLRNHSLGTLDRVEWLRGVKLILSEKLRGMPIKECMYSGKKSQNLKNVPDYFDENIHSISEEEFLVNLTKVDDKDEIYYISPLVKEILKVNFGDPTIFEGLAGITREILSIVLLQYGKHKKLYTSNKKELYFKIWEDPIFKEFFPIKREQFKKLLEKNVVFTKDVINMLQEAADGRITTENLTNLIASLLEPADVISMDKITGLTLPPEKSYIDPKLSVNIIEFMVDKVNKLIDGLKKKIA